MSTVLVDLVITVGFAVAWYKAGRSTSSRVTRFATSVRLSLDEDTATMVGRRLRRRYRANALGAWLGFMVGSTANLLIDPTVAIAWWLAMGLVGGGAGILITQVLEVRDAARRPGPRAAVLAPRRVLDYLTPGEVGIQYAGLALPVIALCVALTSLLGGEPHHGRIGWVLAAVAANLVIVVACVLLQRRALHVAPVTDSPHRLRWEDALRGQALRDLTVSAFATSWALGGLTAFGATSQWLVGFPFALIPVTIIGFGVATIALFWLLITEEKGAGSARRFHRLYGGSTAEGAHQ